MKLKNLFWYIVILSSCYGYGQVDSSKIDKANKAFEGFSYDKALELYQSLAQETIETKRNTALSLWRLNNTTDAEPIFHEIVNTKGYKAEDIYNYAVILRENKKYAESEIWLKKYTAENPDDNRNGLILADKNSYQLLSQPNPDFSIENLEINTEQQEFGPNFFKDQVVFISSREETKAVRRKWNANSLPFLDIYTANRAEDNTLSYPRLFAGNVNKKYHEGPLSFSPDNKIVAYTCNNYDGKSSKGFTRLKLSFAQFEDGKWKDLPDFPYNNTEFSTGHPNFTNDGKWLYFASNMPGGYGGVDLYRCAVLENNQYGEPENLGPKINTAGDEMFPFVHANNQMLFFTSDGRIGLGGMDIYLGQIKGNGTFGKIMNLGAPINSNKDDFSFVMKEDQSYGYFASNRDGGKGSDDIYSFSLSKPYEFGKEVIGVSRDENGDIIANTRVVLFDLISGEEEVVITGEDGKFSFLLEEEKTYNIRGQKEGFFDAVSGVDTYAKDNFVKVDLVLEKDPGLSIFLHVFDKKTQLPIRDAKITLINNVFANEASYNTNLRGDLLVPLHDNKVNDRISYTVLLEKKGYLSKEVIYSETMKVNGKYLLSKKVDLGMSKVTKGSDLGQMLNLENLHFDSQKAVLSAPANNALDKVVKVLNDHPEMKIEVKTYTDARGSESSNLALSKKRAETICKYMRSQVSNPDRILGNGYGEANLLNDCRENKDCTEDEHNVNNRSLFIILEL